MTTLAPAPPPPSAIDAAPASRAGAPSGLDTPPAGLVHAGAPSGLDAPYAGLVHAGAPSGLDTPPAGLVEAIAGFDDVAVRRNARTLHAACAELLPGYAAASREPWRQALLTAGCLDGPPRRGPARRAAPPLIVEDVVQPSDVLCALWLARRCGLFSPGSACGDGVGRRSACDILPAFAPSLPPQRRAEVLETLRANTAWRAHRLARAG